MKRTDEGVLREWQNQDFKEILEYLSKQEINSYLDIGGYTGISFEIISNLFPLKEIDSHIFEPFKENFDLINERIKKLNKKKVSVYNYAIYYGTRFQQAFGSGDLNQGGFMLEESVKELEEKRNFKAIAYDSVFFQTVTLEEFFKNGFDLVKIDIEGSEYNVIKNSSIIKKSNFILLETHIYDSKFNQVFLETFLPNFSIIFNLEEFHQLLLKRRFE